MTTMSVSALTSIARSFFLILRRPPRSTLFPYTTCRRQRRIEAVVAGDGEEVFRLYIDARQRDPANERRGQRVPDLYVAQPDVGATLDVIAADLPAEGVVLVDSRILRVGVSRVGAPIVPRQAPGIGQQVVADVRREVAEDVRSEEHTSELQSPM